jgi:GT2 family glycosyltransferase
MSSSVVIVINFNSGRHLERCLDSISARAASPVIVVDNASTDASQRAPKGRHTRAAGRQHGQPRIRESRESGARSQTSRASCSIQTACWRLALEVWPPN